MARRPSSVSGYAWLFSTAATRSLSVPCVRPSCLQDAVHFLLDLGDALEPDLVNLVSCQFVVVNRRRANV